MMTLGLKLNRRRLKTTADVSLHADQLEGQGTLPQFKMAADWKKLSIGK